MYTITPTDSLAYKHLEQLSDNVDKLVTIATKPHPSSAISSSIDSMTSCTQNIGQIVSEGQDSICGEIQQIAEILREQNAVTVWGMNNDLASILIPALVSVLIFALGILIQQAIEYLSNRRRILNFRDTVLFWSKSLIEPLQKQSESFTSFSTSVATDNQLREQPLQLHSIEVGPLNELPFEQYLLAFKNSTQPLEKTDAAEEYINHVTRGMITQFKQVESLMARALMEYEQYLDQTHDYMKRWNGTFSKAREIIDGLIVAYPGDQNIKALKGLILYLLNNQPQGVDIDFFTQYFITPVGAWAAATAGNQTYGNTSLSLRAVVLELDQILHMFKLSVKQGYEMRFQEHAKTLNTALNNIETATKFFSESRLKFILPKF